MVGPNGTSGLDALFDPGAPRDLTAYSANWATFTRLGSVCQTQTGGGINGAGGASDYWTTLYAVNQEVFATLVTFSTDNITLWARLQNPASVVTGYQMFFAIPNSWGVARWTAGSNFSILSGTHAMAVGDGLALSCIGSIIAAWYRPGLGAWTLLGSVVDRNVPQGGFLGVELYTDVMKDFGGGTVPGPRTSVVSAYSEGLA